MKIYEGTIWREFDDRGLLFRVDSINRYRTPSGFESKPGYVFYSPKDFDKRIFTDDNPKRPGVHHERMFEMRRDEFLLCYEEIKPRGVTGA